MTVYKNSEGQNKAVRRHLRKVHGDHWVHTVVLRKLKGWEALRLKKRVEKAASEARVYEQFTLEGFLKRLIRWIAVDDQVC